MDYAVLATEIAKPEFAQFQPDGTPEMCAILNAPTESMPKEKFANARTILASMGPAGAVALDKLAAFAAAPAPIDLTAAALHSAVSWSMSFIRSESGIDVGHPTTRALLDALATAGVLSTGEAAAIKAIGVLPASRAEVLFGAGAVVTDEDIRAAQGA